MYEINEDLDKGEIKPVDWAVEGAQVTINRTVYRDGSTIIQDTFRTTYEPWAAVCEYGPGTKDYPPEGSDRDRFSCRLKMTNLGFTQISLEIASQFWLLWY